MLYTHIVLGLIFAVLMPIAAMMFSFLRLWTKVNIKDLTAVEDAPPVEAQATRTRFEQAFENLPLMVLPPKGARVKLLVEDAFLADYCGAHQGDIGIVVDYSRLGADDNGVIVNWGKGTREDPDDNSGARCDLSELALYFDPTTIDERTR